MPLLTTGLALATIPIFGTWLLTRFPDDPHKPTVYPSLASLPDDSEARQIYPEDFYPGGAYADMPYGKVRYWLFGPAEGRKVVLIHGLSTPSLIWKDVAHTLADSGYRVLLYDLYGRGYTEAPKTEYNAALYSTQLALLMQVVGWSKAIICGVSMGGSVAAAFTAQFPHLVDERIVLICSAGLMKESDLTVKIKIASAPGIRTIATSRPILKRLIRSTVPSFTSKELEGEAESSAVDGVETTSEEEAGNKQVQAAARLMELQSGYLTGYMEALISSIREGPVRGQHSAFRSSGFEGKRVLLIHGRADKVVNPSYSNEIFALLPTETRKKSRQLWITGGEHDITLTHGKKVGRILADWFAGKEIRDD